MAAKDDMRRRAEARAAFQQQLASMSEKVLAALPLDTAADQLAKRQLTDYRLPPAFSRRQLRGCHHGPGVKEQVVINEGSWVRLCSRGAVRLCIEDNASNSPGGTELNASVSLAIAVAESPAFLARSASHLAVKAFVSPSATTCPAATMAPVALSMASSSEAAGAM